MAAKRGNGEGSIYQVKVGRQAGLWRGTVTLPDGSRKYLTGRTREDVAKKVTQALAAVDRGLPVRSDERLTVGAFLTKWLEESARPAVRPKTYLGYKLYVERHLVPGLGRENLARLTPQRVQAFLNAKAGEASGRDCASRASRTRRGLAPAPASALAPRTVLHIRAVLRKALNQALRWGLVGRNVATLVELPRAAGTAPGGHEGGDEGSGSDIRPLAPEQATVLLEAVRGDRLEALYTVALALGLRQGEALGLAWRDVDLPPAPAGDGLAGRGATGGTVLRVRAAAQRTKLDGVSAIRFVAPKTRRSRRVLHLPAVVAEALRRHRVRQLEERLAAGDRWREHGLVFTTGLGTPLDASNVTHYFQRHLKRAGLPRRRFHDLRHTCATLLLVQGVHPRVVMETLGHSQISLTMNTYSHIVPALQRDAADRMDALLTPRALGAASS